MKIHPQSCRKDKMMSLGYVTGRAPADLRTLLVGTQAPLGRGEEVVVVGLVEEVRE